MHATFEACGDARGTVRGCEATGRLRAREVRPGALLFEVVLPGDEGGGLRRRSRAVTHPQVDFEARVEEEDGGSLELGDGGWLGALWGLRHLAAEAWSRDVE